MECDRPMIKPVEKWVFKNGERQNLKNRRIEILVTNYQNSQGKFDFE